MSWWELAKCRGVSPAIFFPEGPGRNNSREAKTICARCPVQLDCLEWAIEHNERLGVWGGLTPQERRQPRLRRCVECDAQFRNPSRLFSERTRLKGERSRYCSPACAAVAHKRQQVASNRRRLVSR